MREMIRTIELPAMYLRADNHEYQNLFCEKSISICSALLESVARYTGSYLPFLKLI